MNKTTNYQLNQWEATDQVRRTDFNADNAKIDAAIAQAALGNCRVEYGTYVGTGVYGDTSSKATVLQLGYRPKLVFVTSTVSSGTGMFCYPNPAALHIHSGGGSSLTVEWMSDGLKWWAANAYSKVASTQLNEQGVTYHYVAFH